MNEIELMKLKTDLPTMSLSEVATVVKKDWKKVYFGAVPYLNAMATMNSVRDNFGADSGQSIVTYFLSNAQTWRGPVARLVKERLNKDIK
jgi:hypothetical protein